ncbi:MAG: hypothetical protein J6Z38_01995 [Lachnospiraceae bacterium]|nr:hypothetical protein [Lachnospiraceae bacterium]
MTGRRKRAAAALMGVLMLLCTVCGCLQPGNTAPTEALKYNLDKVQCTFLGETMDVTRNVMEIPGGMAEPVRMQVEFSFGPEGMIYSVCQMNGTEITQIAESTSSDFTFMADELKAGIPVYMKVMDKDRKPLTVRALALRVHKSLMAERVPDSIGSEFGSGFKIDMSDFVSGMALNVLPFVIPVTVKTYADGAVRVGIGYNSTDKDFWVKAGSGKMPEKEAAETLKNLYNKEYNKTNQKPKGESLGLVFLISGWAEGNIDTKDPIKGHVEMYIGSGLDINGQYMLFTWDIILTAGAEGSFDFSFKFNEAESKYNFSADEILLGIKWGVEVYGGIGCKFASVGVYGAASLEYLEEMYPDPEAEHLILAGEVGLKAKLFGKVLASFTIISGSHDFLEKDKLAEVFATGLSDDEIRDYLYANNYANTAGVLIDDNGEAVWFGTDVESTPVPNSWEEVRDFTHLLASDIYPDNHVQIANVGSRALPAMDVVFLGNDRTREAGNRSVLMSSYYDIATEYLADPVPVADDGTADFDPHLYGSTYGRTYLVWKNALTPLKEDMTFSEIAANTEIVCAEYQIGSSWYTPKQVTNFAGTGKFAASARVTEEADGKPVIAYFTNSVDDPLGLGGEHEVYLAKPESGKWVSEKVTEITGTVLSVDVSPFGYDNAVAVSFETGGKAFTALWRDGKKIWEKENAENARFVSAGNNYMRLVYYEGGRLYVLTPEGNETPLTPETITIPNSHYELYGHLGSSPLMIVGTSVKDTSGNAFAYVSNNGGLTWGKADLTHVEKNATVTHIGAAFTYENEPILVYSVQNYEVSTDHEKAMEDPASYQGSSGLSGGIQLGDDARFTDTQADLYIKARRMNRHVKLSDGTAKNTDSALPDRPLKIELTVRNTGLYDVDRAVILYQGEQLGVLNKTLKPGEEGTVEVTVMIPKGAEEGLSYRFEVTTRDDLEPESSLEVPVDPGHLEVTNTEHIFFKDQESIAYRIENFGYTEKPFRIVARDEIRGTVIYEKKDSVIPGGIYSSRYDAPNGLFSKNGYENVTLYILFGDEQPGDPDISVNRVYSIMPLEEIYGQPVDPLEK